MAEEKIPTWLYHKTKGGKIHMLAPRSRVNPRSDDISASRQKPTCAAPLPKGWRDTPWPEETHAQEKHNAKEAENETG